VLSWEVSLQGRSENICSVEIWVFVDNVDQETCPWNVILYKKKMLVSSSKYVAGSIVWDVHGPQSFSLHGCRVG